MNSTFAAVLAAIFALAVLTGCVTPPPLTSSAAPAAEPSQPSAVEPSSSAAPIEIAAPADTPETRYLELARRGLEAIDSDLHTRYSSAQFEGAALAAGESWCGSLASNPSYITESPEFLETAAQGVEDSGLMSRAEFFVMTNAAERELC
jgi:hypothetical protein